MDLDFSILDGIGTPAASTANKEEVPQDLQRESEKRTQKRDYALEVYKVYQERTKATEGLQNAIMKGLNAGEPINDLFLKAMKALGMAVDDMPMYEQAARIINEKY